MKFFLLIGLLCWTIPSSGKKLCSCNSKPGLNDAISCKPIVFRNKARLYWQFNCDSSWLTLQTASGKKVVIDALDQSIMDMTGRLGYMFTAEYGSTFLMLHNVISGCCDPPEFILFDKSKGTARKTLGRLIFYSDLPQYPIVIYFANSNYDSFNASPIDNNTLTVLNIDLNRKWTIHLPKNRVARTMDMANELFAEHLFDAVELSATVHGKSGLLTIPYRYKVAQGQDNWINTRLEIDLKKYCGG